MLPQIQANEVVLEHLERRRLGDQGRFGKNRLVQRTLQGLLQELRRRKRLRLEGKIFDVPNQLQVPSVQQESMAVGEPQPRIQWEVEVDEEDVHGLRLLQGLQAIPFRIPQGMLP